MKLLHLDSSITGKHSVSRALSAEIVAAHLAQRPGTEVTYHDLANEPLLHLSPAHLAAFQGGQVESAALGQDVAQGVRYLDELIAADVVVIGAPMYNAESLAQGLDRPGSSLARPSATPDAAQAFCLQQKTLHRHRPAACIRATARQFEHVSRI